MSGFHAYRYKVERSKRLAFHCLPRFHVTMNASSTPDLWRKFMVPTDFSECATAAIHTAASLLGSVTEKVVHHAPCSVLVVR